jgi:hypothetical protein
MQFEVEEIEEQPDSRHYLVTFGYWAKDSKPSTPLKGPSTIEESMELRKRSQSADLFNPWRRKYKRVEVDPDQGKVIAIRMYEPPLGVS